MSVNSFNEKETTPPKKNLPVKRRRGRPPKVPATALYQGLPSKDATALLKLSKKFERVMGKTAEDTIELGRVVREALKITQYGRKLELAEEWGVNLRTLQYLANVGERFGDSDLKKANLSATALYLLASPSTPDDIVTKALDGAMDGKAMTTRQIREEIQKAKGKPAQKQLPWHDGLATAYQKAEKSACVVRVLTGVDAEIPNKALAAHAEHIPGLPDGAVVMVACHGVDVNGILKAALMQRQGDVSDDEEGISVDARVLEEGEGDE